MGVEGSGKLLGNGVECDIRSKKQDGKNSIVIDASHLVFQLGKGHCTTNEIIRDSSGKTITACYKTLEFVLTWLREYVINAESDGNGCVIPIFVFDGKASSAKGNTIQKRREKRRTAGARLETIVDTMDVADPKAEDEILGPIEIDTNHSVTGAPNTANMTGAAGAAEPIRTVEVIEDAGAGKEARAETVGSPVHDVTGTSPDAKKVFLIKQIDVDMSELYSDMQYHSSRCISRLRSTKIEMDDKYTRSLRNAYNPSHELSLIRLMLEWMGIPCIDSKHEGDAQCAAIDIGLNTHGTITGDIDILLLGGRSIFRVINSNTLHMKQYGLINVINNIKGRYRGLAKLMVRENIEYDRSIVNNFKLADLRTVCCLMGTDYCQGIKFTKNNNDGDIILALYAMCGRDIRSVLEQMRDNKEGIIDDLQKMNLIKRSDVIFDSERITNGYIQRMLGAYSQYDSEKVQFPKSDAITLSKFSKIDLISFCQTFMNNDSMNSMFSILERAKRAFDRYVAESADFADTFDSSPDVSDVSDASDTTATDGKQEITDESIVPHADNYSNFGSYHRRCHRMGKTKKSRRIDPVVLQPRFLPKSQATRCDCG